MNMSRSAAHLIENDLILSFITHWGLMVDCIAMTILTVVSFDDLPLLSADC